MPLLHALPALTNSVVQAILQVIDQQGSFVTRTLVSERLREYMIAHQDTVGIQHYTAQVLTLARQLPSGTLVDSLLWPNQFQPVWRTYHDLLRNAFYHAPDSLHVIAQRAQQDLGVWQTYHPDGKGGLTKGSRINFQTLSAEATIDTLWHGHLLRKDTARTVLPALHADFWFGPTHAAITNAAANGVSPLRGQVTFIMVGTVDAQARSVGQQASLVRQMLAQYGPRGFGLTVVTLARGWLNYGDYERALEPVTPAAEAEQIRSYYQDYEGLPITVGVQVQHYTKRPPPDGRLVHIDTLDPVVPSCPTVGCALLVGRDGTVLWSGNMLDADRDGGPDGGALLGLKSEFRDILAQGDCRSAACEAVTLPTMPITRPSASSAATAPRSPTAASSPASPTHRS